MLQGLKWEATYGDLLPVSAVGLDPTCNSGIMKHHVFLKWIKFL